MTDQICIWKSWRCTETDGTCAVVAVNFPQLLLQERKTRAKSPFPGALTVTFMLHRWPWQHLTTRAGEGGVAQVARPSSSSLRQPFCWTAAPSIISREEKQCWPLQRRSGWHAAPSHTQVCSLRTGLPADGSASEKG